MTLMVLPYSGALLITVFDSAESAMGFAVAAWTTAQRVSKVTTSGNKRFFIIPFLSAKIMFLV